MRVRRKQRQSGQAMIEVALMAPWIFFLFVGVFDFGFYAASLISVQNAARDAALRTATFNIQSTTDACQAAIDDLKWMANARSLTTTCSAPITVTLDTLCGASTPASIPCPNGRPSNPQCADCLLDPTAASVVAKVTYDTIPLIPIPGILPGKMTLVRTAEARIIQ